MKNFIYLFFFLCFTSKAEASNTADKRIMGKNTNPHVVFQCHDVNDPKPYLLGFTPVFHSNDNESYYVVTFLECKMVIIYQMQLKAMFCFNEFHGETFGMKLLKVKVKFYRDILSLSW